MSEHGVKRNGQLQVRAINRLEGAVHRRNRRTRRGIVAALTASLGIGILAMGLPTPARAVRPEPVSVEAVSEGFGSTFERTVASLPDCTVEDGSDMPAGSACRWLADEAGNGEGVSFWVRRNGDESGTFHYADGHVEVIG